MVADVAFNDDGKLTFSSSFVKLCESARIFRRSQGVIDRVNF